MRNLETLLRTKVRMRNGVKFSPDFRIAVQKESEEGVTILVHPLGHNGKAEDFLIKGNEVIPARI